MKKIAALTEEQINKIKVDTKNILQNLMNRSPDVNLGEDIDPNRWKSIGRTIRRIFAIASNADEWKTKLLSTPLLTVYNKILSADKMAEIEQSYNLWKESNSNDKISIIIPAVAEPVMPERSNRPKTVQSPITHSNTKDLKKKKIEDIKNNPNLTAFDKKRLIEKILNPEGIEDPDAWVTDWNTAQKNPEIKKMIEDRIAKIAYDNRGQLKTFQRHTLYDYFIDLWRYDIKTFKDYMRKWQNNRYEWYSSKFYALEFGTNKTKGKNSVFRAQQKEQAQQAKISNAVIQNTFINNELKEKLGIDILRSGLDIPTQTKILDLAYRIKYELPPAFFHSFTDKLKNIDWNYYQKHSRNFIRDTNGILNVYREILFDPSRIDKINLLSDEEKQAYQDFITDNKMEQHFNQRGVWRPEPGSSAYTFFQQYGNTKYMDAHGNISPIKYAFVKASENNDFNNWIDEINQINTNFVLNWLEKISTGNYTQEEKAQAVKELCNGFDTKIKEMNIKFLNEKNDIYFGYIKDFMEKAKAAGIPHHNKSLASSDTSGKFIAEQVLFDWCPQGKNDDGQTTWITGTQNLYKLQIRNGQIKNIVELIDRLVRGLELKVGGQGVVRTKGQKAFDDPRKLFADKLEEKLKKKKLFKKDPSTDSEPRPELPPTGDPRLWNEQTKMSITPMQADAQANYIKFEILGDILDEMKQRYSIQASFKTKLMKKLALKTNNEYLLNYSLKRLCKKLF